MKKLLLCVIFIIEFIGCAGIAKYQDDTFIYTGSKEFEVALIPLKTGMPIELYSQLDTFFTIVFKDTASGRKIIPSYELFTETENKPPLDPRIAYRIRGYEIKDYKTHRLNDILDEQDMKQLHNSIPNSIFLIVPIIFEIDNNISPNGYFNFRCYELKYGKLLYEKGNSLQLGGCNHEKCDMQCGFFMLGMAGKDFDNYLNEHIK